MTPFILIALLVAGSLGAMLVALLDRNPTVQYPGVPDAADRAQVEQLVVDNSPERLSRNGRQRVELTTDELNLLATFLLHSLPLNRKVALQITPADPVSRIDASIPVGKGLLHGYLNLSAGLRIRESEPELVSLHAGRVPVPEILRNHVVQSITGVAELRETIREIEILEDGVAVNIEWRLDSLEQLRDQARQVLLGPDARQRLLHYYRLAHETGQRKGPADGLHRWLTTLFRSAERRTRQGADPQEENRSALLALAVYVNEIDPRLLMADVPRTLMEKTRDVPPLSGRHDLSRHFLTSAALSAVTNAAIADVLATSKELHEARHGSGFSISDMTANQAGTRLGQTAVGDPESAIMTQRRLSASDSDDFFMPAVGARGSLDEEAFHIRFGSTGSPAYQQLREELEARIDALPLYREP